MTKLYFFKCVHVPQELNFFFRVLSKDAKIRVLYVIKNQKLKKKFMKNEKSWKLMFENSTFVKKLKFHCFKNSFSSHWRQIFLFVLPIDVRKRVHQFDYSPNWNTSLWKTKKWKILPYFDLFCSVHVRVANTKIGES